MPDREQAKTEHSNKPDELEPDGSQTIIMDRSVAAAAATPVTVTAVMDHLDMAASALSELDNPAPTSVLPPSIRAPSVRATEKPNETARDATRSKKDEDLSIERYMTDLLERSRGHSTVSSDEVASEHSTGTAGTARPSEPESSKEPKPAVPRVRKRIPERRDTLSDLRNLANLNARRALNTHCGQQLAFEMHNKLVVILVAMVVSFALINLASSAQSVAYGGAVVALITSVAWTLRYFGMARQLSEFTVDVEEEPETEKENDHESL